MDIIRITIKGSSGYGCVDDAYDDKVTLTSSSIEYNYKPVLETKEHKAKNWKYRTNNDSLESMFQKVAHMVHGILDMEPIENCTDVGVIEFVVTRSDHTKKTRAFLLPSDYFEECFSLIKTCIPPFEEIPMVLRTCDEDW